MNDNFHQLLNWKLQTGSHKFPGPDGGTCINEAAIVVAGFKYKSISSASDCPPCFSLVFSSYLLTLNDKMPDDVRQKLIPFATKLAGSADTEAVEKQRFEYLVREVTHRIIAPMLDKDYPKHAKALRAANTMQEIKVAAYAAYAAAASDAANAASAANAAYAAAASAASAASAAASAASAAYAAYDAYDAAYAAHVAAHVAYAAWDIAIDIANEAFAIGKQADPIEENVIKERIEKIKYGSRSGRDVSLVRTTSG